MSVHGLSSFRNAKENAGVFDGKINVKSQNIGSIKKTKALTDVKNTVHAKNVLGSTKKNVLKDKEKKCTPFHVPTVKAGSMIIKEDNENVFYEEYHCSGCHNDDDFDSMMLLPEPRLTAADIEKMAVPFSSPKKPIAPVPLSPGFTGFFAKAKVDAHQHTNLQFSPFVSPVKFGSDYEEPEPVIDYEDW